MTTQAKAVPAAVRRYLSERATQNNLKRWANSTPEQRKKNTLAANRARRFKKYNDPDFTL